MKVLKYSENYLVFLGICSHQLNKPTNEFLKTVNTFVFLIGLLGLLSGCSAAYIYQNFSDLVTSINALFILSSGIACAGSYISIGINMKTVKRLHNELQRIVNEGTKRVPFLISYCSLRYNALLSVFYAAKEKGFLEIYQKGERKSRFWTKWISIVLFVSGIVFLFSIPIVLSSYSMWKGNYEPSTWYLTFKMVVPFDTSTIFGWHIFWLVQMYAGYCWMFTISAISTYFISCCFYVEACCEQLKMMLDAFDKYFGKRNKNERLKKLELKKRIGDVIAFHIDAIK